MMGKHGIGIDNSEKQPIVSQWLPRMVPNVAIRVVHEPLYSANIYIVMTIVSNNFAIVMANIVIVIVITFTIIIRVQ